MSTYEEFVAKNTSTKTTLVWIEPSERLLLWTLDSGAIYKKSVNYYVISVVVNGSFLTQASSSSLNAGEFYFNPATKEVYVRLGDDSNPQSSKVVANYRLFYSSEPYNLPYDLLSGAVVEYQGRLSQEPSISQALDEEQIGIALDSTTSLSFQNSDAHFDDFIDVLFFENKPVSIYSWSPSIPLSEKRLLFKGIIQDKSISPEKAGFSVRDEIYKLRQPVVQTLFGSSDGTVSETYLNTPKRRIYGQVRQARCVPIDNVLNGFTLTGTISGSNGGNTLTGVGTSFLAEVSPNDKLILELETENIELGVESVDSDAQVTISETLNRTLSAVTLINQPERPYRGKNRNWHIAGHKLRAPSTTITAIPQLNRFSVADGSDFFANDLIDVDGQDVFIKRIVGNDIVLTTNLQGAKPSIGASVTKNPVSKVFISNREAFINRDWTVSNTSTDAILQLDPLAEFNIAIRQNIIGTLTFTNGSRTVTSTGADLASEVRPRDWVISDDLAHQVWYEVLSVTETTLTLRTAYAGSSNTGSADKKRVDLISDETNVCVDAIGYENAGIWLKTASDAVNHLLSNDVGATNLNAQSFTDSKEAMPYTLSYITPHEIGGQVETVKSVISKINASVFGSLVFDENFNYKYQVLSTERPTDIQTLSDDDFIGDFSASTKNNIVRKVKSTYSNFFDIFLQENTSNFYEYTSQIVDDLVGTKEEKEVTLFLFNQNDAETITQRYAFHNALSQSKIKLSGDLRLAIKQLGEKIILNLDRLYKRFGNRDTRKVGIVNSYRRTGKTGEVELIDLGNAFNRNPAIAENTANDFTTATDSEKILNGYIVDNDLEVPDTSSEIELNTQVIG